MKIKVGTSFDVYSIERSTTLFSSLESALNSALTMQSPHTEIPKVYRYRVSVCFRDTVFPAVAPHKPPMLEVE